MLLKIKHSNKYKTFENKSITKKNQRQSKLKDYKIFELKYENNVWKYK